MLAIAICLLTLFAASPSAYAVDSMPTKREWRHDVRVAMKGSGYYVDDRIAAGGTKLAINFDFVGEDYERAFRLPTIAIGWANAGGWPCSIG